MAKVLIGSDLGTYSFNKTAKTITFSGFTASLERILLITDVTANTVIYQFNDGTLGGTLSGNVLTLTFNTNTGSFADTDKLQIFYWSEEPQQTALVDLAMSIKRDMQMIRRDPMQSASGLNINVVGGTLPAVSSVSTVTLLNGFGNGSGEYYIPMQHQLVSRDAFNNYKSKIIS